MGLRNDLFYGLFYFYASYIDVGEYDIYYDIMIKWDYCYELVWKLKIIGKICN